MSTSASEIETETETDTDKRSEIRVDFTWASTAPVVDINHRDHQPMLGWKEATMSRTRWGSGFGPS